MSDNFWMGALSGVGFSVACIWFAVILDHYRRKRKWRADLAREVKMNIKKER